MFCDVFQFVKFVKYGKIGSLVTIVQLRKSSMTC